ncbi:MAG: hypothetical protein H6733_00860 [Alphaproteobacteria bacterium]|nr:hypothetical protein [Alphaproteobacteria bacterium]
MSSWQRLDPTLNPGPVVRARIVDLDASARVGTDHVVDCWALIDTGASHSVVDNERVARVLGLQEYDRRRMALAEQGLVELPVYEVAVSFPDFTLPEQVVRVSGMRLPGPFWMLIGMDLLDRTRLELDVRGDERWLRWTPVR